MVKIIPASRDEPMFLIRTKDGREWVPLTAPQVGRLLKEWAKRGGLETTGLTPHCLRRGGLNWAHRARVTGEMLKLMGGGQVQPISGT